MVKLAGPGISASIPQPQALLTSVAVVLELWSVLAQMVLLFWGFLLYFPSHKSMGCECGVDFLLLLLVWDRDVLQECCHMTLRVFNVF